MTVAISEKLVKSWVKDIIALYSKYTPIYTFCPMTFGYGESGHPDRVLVIRGKFIGIEVKKDKNNHHTRPELKAKPNEVMQKRQFKKISAAGGKWYVIHSGNLQVLVDALDQHFDHRSFSEDDFKKLHKFLG